MSYLRAIQIAEARRRKRAIRSAEVRHRRIVERPLGLVLWQLGAEPFTVGAAAWGFDRNARNMVVPGEPRDRELAFRALTRLARPFNEWFENGSRERQVVVPNAATLRLLSNLGRRLAYLRLDGPRPADPALVRFGRHLIFLGERAAVPGQQLTLVLTELLRNHWVTELSDLEGESLAALDAAIDPPKGRTGHAAAAVAERWPIGPVPSQDEDVRLDPLVQEFNRLRQRRTDEAVVAGLRRPIEQHYASLIFEFGWPLLWRCLDRERTFPEASRVERRFASDVEALDRHLDWLRTGGLRRVRQTHRQAAMTLHEWEDAHQRVVSDEALDDRLRMLPYVSKHDALIGRVVAADLEHRVMAKKRAVARPRFTVATFGPCLMPVGKTLWWTQTPKATSAYEIVGTSEGKDGGRLVVLQHGTSSAQRRPEVGEEVVFSIHNESSGRWVVLPKKEPWTHARAAREPEPIESERDAAEWQ